MILPILGIFFIIYGLCSIIRGKIPFIKEYHGVKNIPLHSRIEGGAILLTGVLLLLQPTLQMDKAPLVIVILAIAVIAVLLEVLLKIV